jgi:hypothetical protein
MDGFTKLPKMQCFKEGGSVKSKPVAKCSGGKMKEGGKVDLAQDKAIVKKAFAMHDKQEHEGEKTDLSKLRKGGRAKKEKGTVKKFKDGGAVGVYGAKKKSGDMDSIKKAKDIKPKLLCGGKSVKKMAAGGGVDPGLPGMMPKFAGQGAISNAERAALQNALPGGQGQGSINDMERRRMMARAKNAMTYLGPSQQSQFVNQGGMSQTGVGAPAGPASVADFGTQSVESLKKMGDGMSVIPGRKKGGCVKKMNEGGSLKEVDTEENPGLAKLPTNVRNKMGYAKKGGKIC